MSKLTVEWYENALDKLIREYTEQSIAQKDLMDTGNTFAAGRWMQFEETIRYVKWIRKMAE